MIRKKKHIHEKDRLWDDRAESGWSITWAFVRRHRASYLVGLCLTALSSMLAVWLPWIMGRFADRLAAGTLEAGDVAAFAAVMLAVGAARGVAWWSGGIIVLKKSRQLTYQLRRQLFATWTVMTPDDFRDQSTGDRLSHVMSDVEVVRELFSMEINMTVSALAMLASVLYIMIAHGDWRLTLAGLAPLLAIPFLVRMFAPGLKRSSRRCQEALGHMTRTSEEIVDGIRTVKAFAGEVAVTGQFDRTVDRIVTERTSLIRLSALFDAIIPLLANAGFVIVLGYGGMLCVRGGISIGAFVAFTMYVAMLRNPLVHLGKVLGLIQRTTASLNRIAAVLAAHQETQPRQQIQPRQSLRGDLEIKRLTFRYPGSRRDTLCNISLHLPAGKTLGIIGPTGSGKTALADLLLGLYPPPKNTVFLDGRDIHAHAPGRLRFISAYVPQDGFLFSTSVLENIAFSSDRPDYGRTASAADTAAIHNTILRLPNGYNTIIGERGVNLSGGQKQRMAIARMVYKNARIQVMDDGLSAVDLATEALILENLTVQKKSDFKSKPTTIIISHRLSTVRHADEIIVLAQGHIIERGSHKQLLQGNGNYARLWREQNVLPEGDNEGCAVNKGVKRSESASGRQGHSGRKAVKTDSSKIRSTVKTAPCHALLRLFPPHASALSGTPEDTVAGIVGIAWWGRLAVAVLLVVAVVLVETTQPYLVKEAIDRFITISQPDGMAVAVMAIIYLSMMLVAFGLAWLHEVVLQGLGINMVRMIRRTLFRHLLKLSLPYFNSRQRGAIITNIVNDTETLTVFFSRFFPTALRALLSLGLIMAFMVKLNVAIAAWCFLLIPLIAGISIRFRMTLQSIYQEIRNRLSDLIAFLAENLSGMAVIRIFQQETRQCKAFDRRNIALRDATIRENHQTLLLSSTADFIGDLSIAVMIWFGGRMVIEDAMTFGVLYAFIGYLRQFFRPVNTLVQQVNTLQSSIVAATRIATTLEVKPEQIDTTCAAAPKPKGHIHLDHVSFAYIPGRPVLEDVCLSIPPGGKIGFVGRTGAGKTTLLSLLGRFYDVTAGAIRIDGRNVRKWSLAALRRTVGVVQQDAVLFSGSIVDNVRIFRTDISEQRVRDACRLVGAEAFIERLPYGYHTQLTDRGRTLSSGERQLLFLARGVVYDPRILILDEATAGLDSDTEAVVQEGIRRMSSNRTLLVIAHRLATVRDMDTIVVLDNGRIVEIGSHDRLMAQHGHYHRLSVIGL